ncbi:MAG: c-type cytochrome biogenesis protein CcmI/CycH, partial [Burkholderiales bacterium]
GTVRLNSALANRVAPADTVFVSARAVKGPAMPLAVLRRRAGELPFAFTLDDAQAMMPEMKLSDYAEVTVAARVSKSGSATRQKGDLEGASLKAKVGSSGIELLIDRVVD